MKQNFQSRGFGEGLRLVGCFSPVRERGRRGWLSREPGSELCLWAMGSGCSPGSLFLCSVARLLQTSASMIMALLLLIAD